MVGGLTGGVHVLQALPASQVLHALQNASAAQLQAMQAAIASSAAAWGTQSAWQIDPAAGDDTNTGLVGAPIKTLAEYGRRVILAGGHKFAGTTFVDWLGDAPATDEARGTINVAQSRGAFVVYRGSSGATQLQTGIFSAVTLTNPATNTQMRATDSLARSWAAFIAQLNTPRVRNTTAGARLNSSMWCGFNAGAGVGEFNHPFAPMSLAAGAAGQALGTLVANDTYAIERLPFPGVFGLDFNVDSSSGFETFGREAVAFQDLSFWSPTVAWASLPMFGCNGDTSLAFYNCELAFAKVNCPKYALVNCHRLRLNTADSGPFHVPGCIEYLLGGMTDGILVLHNYNGIIDQRHYARAGVQITGAGDVRLGSLTCPGGSVFAYGSGASGGLIINIFGALEHYGVTTAAQYWQINPGSLLRYFSKTGLTATGVANCLVGSVLRTYAQLPFTDDDGAPAGAGGTKFAGFIA